MEYKIEYFDIESGTVHYVYEIRNSKNEVLYVGKTKRPRQRLYQHVKTKPNSLGNGTFYQNTDVSLYVVAKFKTSEEAFDYEEQLKIKYGFETTERNKRESVWFTMDSKTREQRDIQIHALRNQGLTFIEIGKRLNVSSSTVSNVIKKGNP